MRAIARFVATYGRLPSEFDPDTALGLAANIANVEASHAVSTAQGIDAALGNENMAASLLWQVTGNDRLAQQMAVRAKMQRNLKGRPNG
jgi:hypothetical protein